MKLDIDPKAKGLIFDLDGTLVDSMPVHFDAWRELFDKMGLEFPEKLFNSFAGIPTYKIIPRLNEVYGLTLDPVKTVQKKQEIFLRKVDDIGLIGPIADLVFKYHEKIPMAIGTGSYREFADILIKKTGLDKYIFAVITADDVKNHKPEPDTFLKCAEVIKVDPKDCQVFEDGECGLIAAKRAGMIATDIRPFL